LVALIRRLHNVGLITHWRYQSLYKYCAKKQYFRKEPEPLDRAQYGEISRLWPAVFKALKNSGISLITLSQEIGVSIKEISVLFRGLVFTILK